MGLTARETISDYVSHLQERDFILGAFSTFGVDGLCAELSTMLSAGTDQDVGDAGLFIRDMFLLSPKEVQGPFRRAFRRGELPQRLEHLLVHGSHGKRGTSVYTLGKTCHTPSVPALRMAAERWLEVDPLLLPGLIFELWRLQKKRDVRILEAMVASREYTTRWAVLEATDQGPTGFGAKGVPRRCLELLAHDDSRLIREEAAYRIGATRQPPSCTFNDIYTWFGNHMHQHGLSDYSTAELHRFIETAVPRLVHEREEWRRAHGLE